MLNVALICDFAEERWSSMDLVGQMLFEQIHSRYSDVISIQRIQPTWRRMATSLSIFNSSRLAWNFDRMWNRIIEYPCALRHQRATFDLFHIVDHSYAHLVLHLPVRRTVVTCHDLDVFRCLSEPANSRRAIWLTTLARRIWTGLRSAAHVIFVSEAVREQAARLGLVCKERSSVIRNGTSPNTVDPGADREAMRLLSPAVGSPLILSVASTIPRKRIDILLRILAGVREQYPSATLIRVGGSLTSAQAALARQLKVSGSIIELPFLSRPVLTAVYRRATMLLQPSEAEGFALPVAEAMTCGCPVVASDLPALRETGGHAAVYCQVGNVPQWIETVCKLLSEFDQSPPTRQALQTLSLENARRFQWKDAADQTIDVYKKISGRS